jgi:uncharacterized protein YcgI (DUF1989 family)
MTDAVRPARVTLRARTGQAVRLAPGAMITVLNPAGTQVVDTWALNAANPKEFLSVEHSRAVLASHRSSATFLSLISAGRCSA